MKEKIRVFIDTDVLFDVLAVREEHLKYSAKVLSLCEKGDLEGYISTISVVNCNYLMNRFKIDNPHRKITLLSKILTILPCTVDDIHKSIENKFTDFEDGVQHSIALQSKKCTHIITRNKKDFAMSSLLVMTPEVLITTIFAL